MEPKLALRRWVLAAALVALGLTSACDADGAENAEPAPSGPSASVADPTPTQAPWAALAGPLGRCGPQPARLSDVDFRSFRLRGEGRVLPAVSAGQGPTAVILIHQTNGNGFCGWLDFGGRVADVPGQRVIAMDLCGYGEADCPEGNSSTRQQVEQVRLAVDRAERTGARRIVLVGASMGGSLAVLTAAADRRVDAAVDLSGPDEWGGASVHRRAADVRVPLLIVMAGDERPVEVAAARTTADAAPEGTLVPADRGHGYDLLVDPSGQPTAIASRVLEWVAGR